MTKEDLRECLWLIIAAVAFFCLTLDIVFPLVTLVMKIIFYMGAVVSVIAGISKFFNN